MFIQRLKKIVKIVLGRNTCKNPSELLHKEGISALMAFYSVEKEISVRFSVMFGTLLGAYREHSFIAHDDDLDMTCSIEYLNKALLDCLRKHGFKIIGIYVASDFKGVQLPMEYNGLICDIYFYYGSSDGKKHIYLPLAIENRGWEYSSNCNIFSIKDIALDIEDEFMPCIMNGIRINIPRNTKEILESLYGDSFMTPIKNAHANPPVSYYKLSEKFYTCFPIDLFESFFFDQ